MTFIKIIDCQNNEQNLNTSLIYNVNVHNHRDGDITQIFLNHKDDDYSFATFKTDEPIESVLFRLKGLQ